MKWRTLKQFAIVFLMKGSWNASHLQGLLERVKKERFDFTAKSEPGNRRQWPMIQLANLTRPQQPFDETVYIFGREGEFFEAHKENLAAAKAVASQPHEHYWFGVYLIHFSAECFLKYAYCVTRKELFRIQNVAHKQALHTTWSLDKYPFKGKTLTAETFSHNLNNLRQFFQHYTDAWNYQEFRDLVGHFPPDESWVEERYKRHTQADFQQEFNDYERDFALALGTGGPFGGIS